MLKKLAEQRAAEVAAMQAILDKAKAEDRVLTAEESTSFDAHGEKIKGIDASAERIQAMPAPKTYGLEERAPLHTHDRAEDKPFADFGEFLLSVRAAQAPGGNTDPRLRSTGFSEDGFALPKIEQRSEPGKRIEKRAPSGLGEGIGSEGGFLVAQDVSTSLIQRVYDASQIIGRCRRLPLGPNSNGIKLPYVDETSRATGSRWGGVRAYWADEADQKTASQPKFGRLELNLKKLVALCYATDELLQDAVALGAFMEGAFPQEMAFAVDEAIINGTGVGQPLGILTSPALVTVAKETSQAADTVLYANIVKMYARLWARSFSNSAWFINQDVIPQLTQMTVNVKNVAGSENVGGSAAYMPPGGLTQAPYGTLLGRPVVPIEQAPTVGDAGCILLADMSQYLYIAKDLQTASSIHVRFIYDESVFRFVYRIDGQPAWKAALTPFKGTANTVSPFVALGTV